MDTDGVASVSICVSLWFQRMLYTLDTHADLHPALDIEWLLTNGLGGFASSSIVGCNRRRYHGLLVAATTPPVGRVMALSRIGELVYLDGSREAHELSINHFRTSMHPRGERYLRRFELGESARWEFDVDGVQIVKKLSLVRGKNVAAIRYTVAPPPGRKVELHLLPFVALRDFHHLRTGKSAMHVSEEHGQIVVSAEHEQKLYLSADGARFQHRPDWWREHVYPLETARGLNDTEDLFVPGAFVWQGEGEVTVWAGVERIEDRGLRIEDRGEPAAPSSILNPLSSILQRLHHAAADFVVARNRPDGRPGTTIIAGYPWFSDWGRDTMISLPGLLLCTKRFEEACQVLSVFAEYVSEGMIPNVFDDRTNRPHYNTVDASLWFIHAVHEYLRLSGDTASGEKLLLPACRQIIQGYRDGTRYHIRMDMDGLISAGDAHTQLTWMDAKCDKVVFTPRHGKAVEINALWYNALVLMGESSLAAQVKESFTQTFWRNSFRGLWDVVTGPRRGPDHGAIRPNQIFAASLPHSPLDAEQQRAVVEVCRRELLTPFGLRSLSPTERGYQGTYAGSPFERDSAYHNGTVWAWLIGPFLSAYLKVNDHSSPAVAQAREWLQPLLDHMAGTANPACLGQISECFDGDAPHHPVGCPAQAWSVAEVLRVAVELGL